MRIFIVLIALTVTATLLPVGPSNASESATTAPTTSQLTGPGSPASSAGPSDSESLRTLLSFIRNAMLTYKSQNGTYPRDLAKALKDSDLDALGLPPSFLYRVFVVPACVRQSKPTDKTEWTNVTETKRKSAELKTTIVRIDKAAETMNDKLVDMKCPNPREDFRVIGIGYEKGAMTISLVDRRKVDALASRAHEPPKAKK
jgi:hypothetical protein